MKNNIIYMENIFDFVKIRKYGKQSLVAIPQWAVSQLQGRYLKVFIKDGLLIYKPVPVEE